MMPADEFTLKVVRGPGQEANQAFVFTKKTVHIGSSYAQNDLIANVEGISAQHARIWRDKRRFLIQNLCDEQVKIADGIVLTNGQTSELEPGAEVKLGMIGLQVFDGADHNGTDDKRKDRSPERKWGNGGRRTVSRTKMKKMIRIGIVSLGVFLILIMALDGVKESKRNGGETAYPSASSEESIALPAKGQYGYIEKNDKSHPDKAIFTFDTDVANVELYYTAGKIDSDKEVSISLNGQSIGYAPPSKMDWGQETVVRLPKDHLIKGGENRLIFDSMENPPHRNQWAVKNIWVKALAANLCDVEKARKMIELGEEKYNQKTISKGNLYLAYQYYCDAVAHLQDCDKDMDILQQAELKKKRSMHELDALYNGFKFAFKKAFQVNDLKKCESILQDVLLHIPDKSDKRYQHAVEQLEKYERYFHVQRH